MFLKASRTFSENKLRRMKLKKIYMQKKVTRWVNNTTNKFQRGDIQNITKILIVGVQTNICGASRLYYTSTQSQTQMSFFLPFSFLSSSLSFSFLCTFLSLLLNLEKVAKSIHSFTVYEMNLFILFLFFSLCI